MIPVVEKTATVPVMTESPRKPEPVRRPEQASAAGAPPETPIAYLNSEYPSLSHTFIEREVRALREMGWRIETYSVRAGGRHATLSGAHQQAARETTVILGNRAAFLVDVVSALVTSPLRCLRTMLAAQRMAPPGVESRLHHMAYAAEGMWLARRLARRGIRHVHCHMANNGAAVALLACRYDTRLRYSLSIHGSAEFFHVDTWALAPKVENAAFVRCISDFCKAQIMAWTSPSCWGRLHVVHCGIESDSRTPRPRSASGPLRLITVGRLHPIKGYLLLLEACRRLSDEGIDWTLDVVGDGPMRGTIAAQVERLGLAPRVRLSGAVGQDDIAAHYDRADVIVVSSFMEGVPVVLMEAMAMGLGVLTTGVGGIPELVDSGVSGVVVPPGSAHTLADGLRTLARSRGSIPAMGEAGRRKVLSEFSIAQTATGMHSLFCRYLGAAEDKS